MSLRMFDGFDHVPSIGYVGSWGKWTTYGGNSPQVGAYGRFSSNGFRCGDNAAYLYRLFSSGHATWVMGFAVYIANTNPGRIMAFADAGTIQVDLYRNSSFLLEVRRAGSTILATGTKVMTAGAWYYVEIKATIDDSTGTVSVKVDGTTDITASSLDTKNTANASANGVYLGEAGTAYYTFNQFDDVYVLDGAGSSPHNDFLGDVRCQTIYPNGNGNSSQLDGSDGNTTDNYLLVDETTPNDDTDYVESADVGDKDTYAFGNVAAATGTVFAVQPLPWARKTDAGIRKIATVARLSGTEEDSADIALGSGFSGFHDIRTTKPGGGAWTITDVNSAEFGVKVSA